MTETVSQDLSASSFSQAEIPFGLAFLRYDAFSAAVQRKCTCSDALSLGGFLGAPRLRLVLSIHRIMGYTNNPCNPSLGML